MEGAAKPRLETPEAGEVVIGSDLKQSVWTRIYSRRFARSNGAETGPGQRAWKQAILRALRDYGAYFGDDTSSPLTFTSFESGTGYTAIGLADPFERFARNHLGQGISESGGTYYFDLRSGVDWSKLRVIAPCVAERSC